MLKESYKIKVIKPNNIVYNVLLLQHKISKEWSFINLTVGHICPCVFATFADAKKYLDDNIKNGAVLDYKLSYITDDNNDIPLYNKYGERLVTYSDVGYLVHRGFKEECEFIHTSKVEDLDGTYRDVLTPIPTLEQVRRWLWTRYKYHVEIYNNATGWGWILNSEYGTRVDEIKDSIFYESYDDALYAIISLIFFSGYKYPNFLNINQ